MRINDKYFIRILFQNKVFKNNGQAFEDFFCEIMENYNNNFKRVKAYGNIGDKKNDGFDKVNGTYYQVYAPEQIQKSTKNAINKLNNDFKGLYKNWNSIRAVKEYYFVINDKYNGVSPDLYKALAELKKEYPQVKFEILIAKDLENIFFNLDNDKIYNIVGLIPSDNKDLPDMDILNEIINYMSNNAPKPSSDDFNINPDFDKKIQFNKLSKYHEDLLKSNRKYSYIIDEYFQYNSKFAKDFIKGSFKHLYEEGNNKIPIEERKGDNVFIYIFDNAYKNKQKLAYVQCVLILMSYYFECCDIFEPPTT